MNLAKAKPLPPSALRQTQDAKSQRQVAVRPHGGDVTPYDPDPRLAALADRLEDQIGLADKLVTAFGDRAIDALNAAAVLPITHTRRAAELDAASRLGSTAARLLQASAAAAGAIQKLRDGGTRQTIVVERAVFMAGGDQGVGPRA